MSISMYRGQVDRLRNDIAALRKTDAQEAKKEASAFEKANRAQAAAGRSNSASTVQSKMNEFQRAQSDLVRIAGKRADLSKKIAVKEKDLGRKLDQLGKEEARERKKIADEERKLRKEQQDSDRRLKMSIVKSRAISDSIKSVSSVDNEAEYDFFISHASEDKDEFVRPLVEALQNKGASVWFDEATLSVGDSLRREIDKGLGKSRFGVVVLSESFFSKEWPQRELDGLTSLEVAGASRILPIWHKVTVDEVRRNSPVLADRVALKTADHSLERIVADLMGLIRK